jgi:hypothetical protein
MVELPLIKVPFVEEELTKAIGIKSKSKEGEGERPRRRHI